MFVVVFALSSVGVGEGLASDLVDDYLKGQETGICEIHHVHMVRHIVNPTYGYPFYIGPFTAASRHFLNWTTHVSGGCMIPEKPEKAAIYVCPECKRLARKWALKHPKDAMAQEVLDETKT